MTDEPSEYEVAVIGGGPAGSAAGVFTARYGLETVVFDRGPGALPRAAYVENYPGFPAGIDVGTLRDLLHDHLQESGSRLVAETVESVEEDADRFRVVTDSRQITADYVVAAAWYDGSYLRPVVGEEAFHVHEHHGEERERFDPDYPDADGRTPVDGLYVAAPSGDRNDQVAVSVGHGAHVARELLADHRRAEGFPDGVAEHYDWLRPESEFSGEWADRDRWREWFANEAGDHDLTDERFVELRERYIDRAFDTQLSEVEIERRRERGHRRLAEHLDSEAVLDAIDDETIREYVVTMDGIDTD
jgi:2-polyprenyl-6-methoxyphenol hydroxylase-like FAD-dependent oxidoreductase